MFSSSLSFRPARILLLGATVACLPPLLPDLFAQGNLTPPGGPGASMRTLLQIEPRTPIESLTGDSAGLYVINNPGSYYLSVGNVAGVSGKAAIAINANDVTIDLNGFSLVGVAGATRGVEIRGAFANLSIHGGSIRNWSSAGIGLSSANAPKSVTIEALRIASVTGPGIDLTGASGVTISHCAVTATASGILLGFNPTGTVHACAVANLAGAGAQTYGIQAGSVTQCDVSTLSGSGPNDCYGISARTAQGCSVAGIDSAGFGNSIGIQADTVAGCTVNSIGLTGTGVNEGIGGNTITSSSVSNVGGPSANSVQFGIVSSGIVTECTVLNVGSSSSPASMNGIMGDMVSRCRVTQISSTSSITGISARVVNASVVSNLVHLGASSGSLVGVSGERVSDCQVDVIGANSSVASVGIYAKRAISGSTASGVGNFGNGGSFGLDLGPGCVAEHCHVGGSSSTGIRAVNNAKITSCEVSGATITIGIDCQAGGSHIDGNNVFGCATGIKAVGTTLVTRNHVTNTTTKFNTAGTCQVGTLINAGGAIAVTTSPWANFTD